MKSLRQYNLILEKLAKAQLRKTEPRMTVLHLMLEQSEPQTAEEIFRKLKNSLDLTTVYRTLQQFEKINLVEKTFFSNKTAKYFLIPLAEKHSHHIECKICHKISPIESCFVEKQTSALQKKGFREISHRLEFFGVCPDCI